jgi:DUF2934 family protein
MPKHTNKPQLVKARRPVKVVPIQNLSARISRIHDLVARRAYELYESRGREPGHELDDWCLAESEVLSTVPFGFMQLGHVFMVDAVPGLGVTNVEVAADPVALSSAVRGKARQPRQANASRVRYSS